MKLEEERAAPESGDGLHVAEAAPSQLSGPGSGPVCETWELKGEVRGGISVPNSQTFKTSRDPGKYVLIYFSPRYFPMLPHCFCLWYGISQMQILTPWFKCLGSTCFQLKFRSSDPKHKQKPKKKKRDTAGCRGRERERERMILIAPTLTGETGPFSLKIFLLPITPFYHNQASSGTYLLLRIILYPINDLG